MRKKEVLYYLQTVNLGSLSNYFDFNNSVSTCRAELPVR